jgi:putative hydrolase of HD superfamily
VSGAGVGSHPAAAPADALAERLAFALELEKLKDVLRRTKPLGLARYENSAEHSWQIATLAIALADLAEEPIDIGRVVRLLLVHDIPEIDAGDTFAYSEQARVEAEAIEARAAERIFGLLPEPAAGEMLALWREFQDNATPEARFANGMDRLMPVLQNLAGGGQSWREHRIVKRQVVEKNGAKIAAASAALWHAVEARLDAAERQGLFEHPPASD